MSKAQESVEAYFHAIEEAFIRLRGAPLLLSPADWKTAEAWHEAGVPLELVQRVLEEVFEGLRERDPERRIHSLRYCAPAVESAWREVRDLTATAGRMEAEPIDVGRRLEGLADEVEAVLSAVPPGAAAALERMVGEVRALGGAAEEVEERLETLDRRMLEECVSALDGGTRQRLEERALKALERAGERVEAEMAADLARRLVRESARRELGLPTLSLFSVDAEDGASV